MGYVRNRGTKQNPKWYVRYKENGRWVERNSKQSTKEGARRFVAAVEERIARGNIGIPELTDEDRQRASITIDQLADRFLGLVEGDPGYVPRRAENLTKYRAQVRSVLKQHIRPAFGGLAAAALKASVVEQWRNQQTAKGRAGTSIAHGDLRVLSKLYAWGRKQGLIDCDNPAVGVERPAYAPTLDFLDAGEVGRLLAHAEDHAAEFAPGVHPMVATAVYTGLRKGELFGLRWSDLDLEVRRLTVARSYKVLPKSGKVRHLRVHPALAVILRRWRDACPETHDRLVFPIRDERAGGWRMGRTDTMLGLEAVLAAAGCHVAAKPWHALRHTFASHFIMKGGNIVTLQKLLGHAKIEMTLIYAHLAPDFMDEEIGRLDFPTGRPANVADLGAERARRDAAGKA